MAKQPRAPQPPGDSPAVPPPRELYDSYDIRLVMNKLGQVEAHLDVLREGQKELIAAVKELDKSLGDKQGDIDRRIASFETALKVGGSLIVAFFAIFWFIVGGDIKALRDLAIRQQAEAAAAENAAAQAEK